jgi:hypothetical protein
MRGACRVLTAKRAENAKTFLKILSPLAGFAVNPWRLCR